jgi:hypothetical protein
VIACQLCAEAARQLVTIGVQLDASERVVLAVPDADGRSYRVVEVIKSKAPVGARIVEPVTDAGGSRPEGRGPFLLINDPLGGGWSSLGTLPVRYAGWLKQLTATYSVEGEHAQPSGPLTLQASFALALSDAAWRERVALVLPRLDDPDPLVGQIAWGELSRAPYATLDVVRSRINAASVTAWLADPHLGPRQAAALLVLGYVGGASDAGSLEQRLESAWSAHEAANLSAMIAADLELRGASRVQWVETKYLTDPARTMPEIDAALLALHTQGDANRAVPRARVIQAYQTFIARHPSMAGFVAPELADWNYWGERAHYAALLEANAIADPASRLAVMSYLQRADAASVAAR